MRLSSLLLVVAVAGVACGPGSAPPQVAPAPSGSAAAAPSASTSTVSPALASSPGDEELGASSTRGVPVGSAASVTPASGKLTLAQARRYMLELVNRDRRSMGLGPVELDEGAPTQSAERHARDMAANGFLGHWGTDGSVPEQRLTEAGGADMVLENAFCITDEKKRELDADPRIDAAEVERAEGMFFNEVPPNDGHRKNILKPFHKRVGIGFALAKPSGNELLTPCISQEFVDVLGTYEPIARSVKAGSKLHVAGTLVKGVEMGAVGLAKLPTPRPLSAAEANKRRAYPVPKPDVMYWPKGFVTPLPVTVDGPRFAIDLPVPGPGFYEISVWGKRPGDTDYATVSLRTLRVE